MAVTFQLPADVEQKLRSLIPDLEGEAKQTYALELFRRGKLSHFELSKVLDLDQFETDAFLKRRNVYEGSLTFDDLEKDRQTLERRTGLRASLMLVIADSSPLIVLVNIHHTQILPILFGKVTIPPQVAAELSHPNRPKLVQDFIINRPAWLDIQVPAKNESFPLLHDGETAAINLAKELKADLLLIDEIQGRKVAAARI